MDGVVDCEMPGAVDQTRLLAGLLARNREPFESGESHESWRDSLLGLGMLGNEAAYRLHRMGPKDDQRDEP